MIIKVPFIDSARAVLFAVRARMECVYFEFTQVYIAQGKPIKPTRKILKNAQQKSCQWLTQCEVPLDIDV